MGNYLINNGFNYGDTSIENKIAKSFAATTNWTSSTVEGEPGNPDNTAFRNKTGFAAFLAGTRDYEGIFGNIESVAYYWTITRNGAYRAKIGIIYYDNAGVTDSDETNRVGFSIRCVQD